MATASIRFTDTEGDEIGVSVDFLPNGARPDSPAHQAALASLEALRDYLKANPAPPEAAPE